MTEKREIGGERRSHPGGHKGGGEEEKRPFKGQPAKPTEVDDDSLDRKPSVGDRRGRT
jgi:hypothetical protein